MTASTDSQISPPEAPGRPATIVEHFGPVRILQLYVVLLLLIPPTYIIEPLGAVGTPATVVGVVALGLWMFGLLSPGDYLRRVVVPLRVVIGILVGTYFVAYAVLHTRGVPGVELLGSDRALLQVLSWSGVVLLAGEGLRDRGELNRVLRTLTASVAVMAIVGILQFYAGVNLADLVRNIPGLTLNADLVSIQDRGGFRRPAGTTTHPIEYGVVIAMALPIAVHLARFGVTRTRMRRWLPLIVIAAGIPVAVSRSAVLCGAVAMLVVLVGLDPKHRPRALAGVAAFCAAVYVTTPGLLGTIRDLILGARGDSSITTRTSDYAVVAEYLRQAPWFGRGPGTFHASYRILDNQFLLSTIEIGLVGVAAVLVYMLTAAFLGRGARHRSSDPGTRDLGQALAASTLAATVALVTFDGFSFLTFAGLVPLVLGVAGALWKLQRPEPAVIFETDLALQGQ